MRGMERIGDLPTHPDHFRCRHSGGRDHSVERAAFDVLHHDARPPIMLQNLVDGDDTWVIQRRSGSRLHQKTVPALGVDTGEKFQRYHTAELPVTRFPNRAHSSLPDLVENEVLRDALSLHWFLFVRRPTAFRVTADSLRDRVRWSTNPPGCNTPTSHPVKDRCRCRQLP